MEHRGVVELVHRGDLRAHVAEHLLAHAPGVGHRGAEPGLAAAVGAEVVGRRGRGVVGDRDRQGAVEDVVRGRVPLTMCYDAARSNEIAFFYKEKYSFSKVLSKS